MLVRPPHDGLDFLGRSRVDDGATDKFFLLNYVEGIVSVWVLEVPAVLQGLVVYDDVPRADALLEVLDSDFESGL